MEAKLRNSVSQLWIISVLLFRTTEFLHTGLRFQHARWNKGHRVQGKKSGEGEKKEKDHNAAKHWRGKNAVADPV